jgi:hypothetical protein
LGQPPIENRHRKTYHCKNNTNQELCLGSALSSKKNRALMYRSTAIFEIKNNPEAGIFFSNPYVPVPGKKVCEQGACLLELTGKHD